MPTELSRYLDFLIALVYTIAIGSVCLSWAYELLVYYFKYRAKYLKQLIDDVLDDRKLNLNFSELFYAHPQIDLTKRTYRHLPAYISSKNFSETLISVIVRTYESMDEKFIPDSKGGQILQKPQVATDIAGRFKEAVAKMNYSDLQILLTNFIDSADGDKDKLIQHISNWFDEYMNRSSGWYKVKTQKRMFWLALVLCIGMNVDFFKVSGVLFHDKELSNAIADYAAAQYEQQKDSFFKTIHTITPTTDTVNNADTINAIPPIDSLQEQYHKDSITAALQCDLLKNNMKLIDSLYKGNAPIGWAADGIYKWKDLSSDKIDWFWKIVGWLISAAVLAIGAPFWFDLLSKLVNLRKAGIKPAESNPKN